MRDSDSAGIARSTMQEYADSGPLRVLTLNVAHGRKDALNQVLVSRDVIERNLAAELARFRASGGQ